MLLLFFDWSFSNQNSTTGGYINPIIGRLVYVSKNLNSSPTLVTNTPSPNDPPTIVSNWWPRQAETTGKIPQTRKVLWLALTGIDLHHLVGSRMTKCIASQTVFVICYFRSVLFVPFSSVARQVNLHRNMDESCQYDLWPSLNEISLPEVRGHSQGRPLGSITFTIHYMPLYNSLKWMITDLKLNCPSPISLLRVRSLCITYALPLFVPIQGTQM